MSSGVLRRGSVLSRVDSTGSDLISCRRCGGLTRGSFEGTHVTSYCRLCRGRLLGSSTVSFSSVVFGAIHLLRNGPSILRLCRGRFGCIVISRCRSASRTRCVLISLLTNKCGGVYIINSSSRDVCHFENTAVRGVLSFRGRCGGTHIVELRRGCHSARGVLSTTGTIVTGGGGHGNGGL